MATLRTGLVTQGRAFKPFPQGTVGVREATYSLGAAFSNGDVFEMLPVYAGETVVGLVLVVDDLDTNGTPTLALDVGDGDDVDRYMDGVTSGQAGGSAFYGANITSAKTILYKYTADDTIDIKAVTGPATSATSGNITLRALIAG